MEPFVGSSNDVYVHSTTAYGMLASYRFMLTPSSAIEGNFGITYHNLIQLHRPTPTHYHSEYAQRGVLRRLRPQLQLPQVQSLCRGGPGRIHLRSHPQPGTTTTLDAKEQLEIGLVYGAGIAYEISPSFDIRAEYRGIITKVPNFGETGTPANLTTNKWYQIYNPVLGVAYHF
jgi:outer membrane immunogenic protein